MIHQAKSNPQLLDDQIFSERIASAISAIGPSVWTGRALQAECDDLELMGLAPLHPALDGTFVLLAIMDIRARSISFASRPRRPCPRRGLGGECVVRTAALA
jgi:hypothetical protein